MGDHSGYRSSKNLATHTFVCLPTTPITTPYRTNLMNHSSKSATIANGHIVKSTNEKNNTMKVK